MHSASLKDLAPTGRIMNSCKAFPSTEAVYGAASKVSWHAKRLPAWLPPLMTLKDGTGITNLSVGFPAILASRAGRCLMQGPSNIFTLYAVCHGLPLRFSVRLVQCTGRVACRLLQHQPGTLPSTRPEWHSHRLWICSSPTHSWNHRS